jgi:glutamate racemase
MKLGVFDSGIGGEAVTKALRQTFPNAEIITVNDHTHVPYGDKTPDEIIRLAGDAIQPLINSGCDIIVLACNTVTALAIDTLRANYPNQIFIGIEPMIKTAAKLTKTKVIAVYATPATLKSDKYHRLIQNFGNNLKIIEPDCSQWAHMIEQNQINYRDIEHAVLNVCNSQADIIILGCTHYHWIKDYIIKVAGNRAQVLEPSESIGNRIRDLLKLG